MTFDFDLWPTDLNINRGHLLIKVYLPTKFEASGAKRSWVISCTRWSRLAWPLILIFDLNINRGHLLIQDYLPTKFEASWAKHSWVIKLAWPLTLDLNINRGHLLIKDYLPSKSEASWAKHSWVISCKRLRDINIPTDMCKAICPSFFKGGGHKYFIIRFVNWGKGDNLYIHKSQLSRALKHHFSGQLVCKWNVWTLIVLHIPKNVVNNQVISKSCKFSNILVLVSLFMPPAWKVHQRHLTFGFSTLFLSICLYTISSRLHSKCNIES